MIRRSTVAATLSAAIVATTARAQARLEPLKASTLAARTQSSCAPIVVGGKAASDEDRRRARDLAARGQQAAILGDSTTALNSLRQAAVLDPTNADLAYQLARVYETAGAGSNAAAEYCRFIALAPTAQEIPEARERIATLAPPRADPAVVAAQEIFNSGIAAYDARRFVEAESRFSAAIKADSTWADAYYDRALVRVAREQRADAVNDFERYLRFKPEAGDRQAVVTRIAALRRSTLSQSQAFTLGLLIPGAGQMYTRRPLPGILALGAAAAAIGFGAQGQVKKSTVEQTGTDPFGNQYSYTVTRSRTEHPYLIPGIAVAGGIAIIGAIEASHYARAFSAPSGRVSLIVAPAGDRLVARVELR